MNAPKTRRQAIASKCKSCIYHPSNGGTWREQVALCTVVGCPLWSFRPLPSNAPAWIASRNPADLPAGWIELQHDDALRMLRGRAPLAEGRGTSTEHAKLAHQSDNLADLCSDNPQDIAAQTDQFSAPRSGSAL